MSKISHNKKRNPALVYEFLVRYVSRCLIENKKTEAAKALAITKKYFGNGTPLFNELRLFNEVLKNNVKSKHSAQRIIAEVCQQAKKINFRQLDSEKSRLIKELNYTFKDPNLYRQKVANYTVYASIQSLLTESRIKKSNLSKIDRIKLEDTIVEHLTRQESGVPVPAIKINSNYSNAVYKFVTKRFHDKYKDKLNESQTKLLMKYATSLISDNKDDLKQYITEQVTSVGKKLSFVRDEEVKKDKDLSQKISECYKRFKESNFSEADDKTILELLQYMKLASEVES